MKKSIVLLCGSLSLSSVGMAQSFSPSVMAVSGGTARSGTMTLDWTLGESVVETAVVAGRIYSQGFHQPMLRVLAQPQPANAEAGYQFAVAPNPVASSLRIDIAAPESSALQLFLTDMTGRQYSVPSVPASASSAQIDMSAYPTGAYLLRISKPNGRVLKSFTIIKAQ